MFVTGFAKLVVGAAGGPIARHRGTESASRTRKVGVTRAYAGVTALHGGPAYNARDDRTIPIMSGADPQPLQLSRPVALRQIIERHLEKILKSDGSVAADGLRRLLRFVVHETIA